MVEVPEFVEVPELVEILEEVVVLRSKSMQVSNFVQAMDKRDIPCLLFFDSEDMSWSYGHFYPQIDPDFATGDIWSIDSGPVRMAVG